MKEIMEKYINHIESKGYSKSYININHYCLNFFYEYCCKKSIDNIQYIDKELIEKYRNYIFRLKKKEKPLSSEVRRRYIKIVEQFFAWAVRNNYILFNPTAGLKIPRLSRSLPKDIFTVREVKRILEAVNVADIPEGLRDKAIIELLYSTGIRRAELLRLDIKDINYREGEILIRDGKGKKDRVIPVSRRALYWLEEYTEVSRPFYLSGTLERNALFFANRGGRLGPNSLQNIVKKYLKLTGIKKPGSCHIFRHSMATHMLEAGADIRYIQRILGHKDLSSTEIYTHVGIVKLKEVHSKTHPSANLGDMKE